MWNYERAFSFYGEKVAQILLTRDDLSNRNRYLNARNTLLTLLDFGVIPVINENDTVVVEEIKSAGGEAVTNADSVASWDGAQRIVQTAIDCFGRIDILCNIAGIDKPKMIWNMSEQEWDQVVAVTAFEKEEKQCRS
jgi:glutamate 5-kinase